VAKILVADDNSNIQKMVGLALKDHGIEVVAVGNGEAAVRKICDTHPDLVLADVFMPVRNGYEVCEYVKDDPALKHIPVILLVGAFDPLDEQEAQRVRADGVLKKPFVPPDPLISMVKSALVRAGIAHAGFAPPKPVPEVSVEAPAAAPAEPRNGKPNFAPKPTAILPEFEMESFVDEAPARPAALKIESGQQPVAFGSLLESPGTDTEEEPNEVTAVPALERDWRTAEVEEEEEEEDEGAKSSWRRDTGSEESHDEVAPPGSGWRDAASEEGTAHGRRHSGWTPTREKADLTEAAEVQETVHNGISDFRNMPVAPFSGEAWAAAIEVGIQNKSAVAEEEHPAPHAQDLEALVGHAEEPALRAESFVSEAPVSEHFASQDVVAQEMVSDRVASESLSEAQISELEKEPEPVVPVVESAGVTVAESEKTSSTTSWFSTPPPSPWDAEAQKATKLASTWDAPVAPAITQPPAPEAAEETVAETTEVTSSFATQVAPDEIEVVSGAAVNSVIPEAVETVREEAAQGVTEIDMDGVVARVLERMSKDRLQEVARDLLKPVIESIVREELNKRS